MEITKYKELEYKIMRIGLRNFADMKNFYSREKEPNESFEETVNRYFKEITSEV